jgi:hypothetical protein
MNATDLRSVRASALALAATVLLPLAAQGDDGPRYSYLDASYQWSDVNYAVRADDSEHEGFRIEASVALADWLHLFGDYYTGDFNTPVAVDPESANPEFRKTDLDFTGYSIGLGLSYPIANRVDLVGRASYVNAELENEDDSGFRVEGMIRGMVGDRAEVQVGYRYTEISGDSDIKNRDVTIGLLYNVTGQLALRASGIVFDDDSGLELGIRYNFGDALLKLF